MNPKTRPIIEVAQHHTSLHLASAGFSPSKLVRMALSAHRMEAKIWVVLMPRYTGLLLRGCDQAVIERILVNSRFAYGDT